MAFPLFLCTFDDAVVFRCILHIKLARLGSALAAGVRSSDIFKSFRARHVHYSGIAHRVGD